MAAPVKLASIGLGWWGGELATAAASVGAEVVSCFARSPETREAFAAEHGCAPAESLESVLASDVDGIMVATPHSTHGELIVLAANAGKHVFVDKPMTLTVADGAKAIAAAEAAGVVLQVGHNKRRLPANRRIRAMIDAGELGSVQHFEATHAVPMLFKPNLPAWRQRAAELPAGGMTPLGVHQVDTIHYLGGPITKVAAFSKRLMPTGELEDTTTINFELASGATAHLFTSVSTGPVVDLAVHGTEGSAWNIADGGQMQFQRRGAPPRSDVAVEQLDTVADEIAEFAAAIRGEATPETGGAEGLAVVAVLEAIVEAAATGGVVEVQAT